MDFKKVAQFAIGPFFSAFIGFVTLPVIAWLFTKDDIGRITMLQVACSLITLVFSLGLDQAYVREYHETKHKEGLLFLSIFPGFLLLVLTVCFTFAVRDKIMFALYDQTSYYLYLLTLASIFAAFFSRFFSLVLRMQEKALAYSMSQVLPKIFFALVILSYWLLSSTRNFENLAFAHLFSLLTILGVLAWNIRNDLIGIFKEKIHWEELKHLLAFGMPLIAGGIAFWGLSTMSRLMLRSLASYSELGLYSVGQNFASAGAIFQSVFSTVWAPTVYKWSAKGEDLEKVDRVTEYVLTFVVFTFSICGMTSWLVPMFLPSDYATVQFVVVACLGQPLLYGLSETTVVGLGLMRKSLFAIAAPAFALVANLFFCWLWIPGYGARGAAASTFVSFLVFFLVRTESSVYVWRSFPRKKIYLFLLAIMFATGVSTFGGDELFYHSLIIWLLIFMVAIFIFKGILMSVLRRFLIVFEVKKFSDLRQ